jgi:hypothetical protein
MKKRAPLELAMIAGLGDIHLNPGAAGRFNEKKKFSPLVLDETQAGLWIAGVHETA